MNRERIQRWIEALRSGEFQQGRGVMRRDIDGKAHYCCLGVAQELFMHDTDDKRWDLHPDQYITPGTYCIADQVMDTAETDLVAFGLPTRACADYYGIPKEWAWELANLNDTGSSFETIADTLEEWLNAE